MSQGSDTTIRATVVIPTRSRRHLLERQVESLLSQETGGFDYEIIVVSDGSTDDTAEYLDRIERESPRVRGIRQTPAGSNAARTRGAMAARGEFVLFTDDDCLAPADWVRACVEGFDRHPEAAGVLGPTTCPRTGISPRTRQVVTGRGNSLYHSCNIAYRRSVLEETGGFDPRIVHSFGDTELAARVLERGPIRYVPGMKMVHPPRSRRWRTALEWRNTLMGEWVLWHRHRDFYRRTRGPHFLLGVLLNWVLGSTVKDLARHFVWGLGHPAGYLEFAWQLVLDKLRLLRVLPSFLRSGRPGKPRPVPEPRPLHVCYFGTYRRGYSRNRILIEGLRRSGVRVTECHRALWQGVEDRVDAVQGGWRRVSFLLRLIRVYFGVLACQLRLREFDVLMVGYPGQFDVYLAKILAFLRRKPLVWDVFMSIYLVARERGLEVANPGTTELLRTLERTALKLPDLLIQDTADYVRWLGGTHGIAPDRFRLVPTGADSRVFRKNGGVPREEGVFRAIYYGTFIPNHGVETVIRAADRLRDVPGVEFELIGDGPTRAAAERLVEERGLSNVQFRDWMAPAELVRRMEAADCCLGAFGSTPQSLMTIQNKVFEGLAVGRAVITGDSPAVRDALTHGRDVWLVERHDPESLANAILTLRSRPELVSLLEQEGHRRFTEQFTVERIGERTRDHLLGLVSRSGRGRPSLVAS